jgi:hypothetical protein
MTDGPNDSSLPFPKDPPSPNVQNTNELRGLDETLSEIRALSATMTTLKKQSVLPKENIWYSDKIYSLQHRLFDILHSPPYQHALDRPVCIAALIFCAVCLRDITFNFRIIYNAVKRLKTAVQHFLDENWTPTVDYQLGIKLFWALGFGGIAAEGKEERAWFVKKFGIMCGVLGLRDWDGGREILDGVLWQSDLDGFGKTLWREASST